MDKFKQAHKMAKAIKKIYKDVDYRFQFSICLKFLNGKDFGKPKAEQEQKKPEKLDMSSKFKKFENFKNIMQNFKHKSATVKFNPWVKGLQCRIYVTVYEAGEAHKIGFIQAEHGILCCDRLEKRPEAVKESIEIIDSILLDIRKKYESSFVCV